MVGAYQQFVRFSGGGGTVTGAINALSLDGTNVVFGGNPLNRNTSFDGDFFNLIFGDATPLLNFNVGFQNSIEFDSILYGGETNLNLSSSDFFIQAFDANNSNSIQLDKNEILINSINSATNQESLNEIRFNQLIDRVFNSSGHQNRILNEIDLHNQTIQNSTFTNDFSKQPFINISQISDASTLSQIIQNTNALQITSRDILNTYFNRFLLNGNQQVFNISGAVVGEDNIQTKQLGRDELTIQNNTDQINWFLNLDSQEIRLNFLQNGRGFFWNNTQFETDFFADIDTKSNGSLIDSNLSSLRSLDSATNITNTVQTNFVDSRLTSSYNSGADVAEIIAIGDSFLEALTSSNLGVREGADYSANYTALNLINKTYGDSHAGGLNITNTPSLNGDVLAYNGLNLTWQPQSGSGGGSLQQLSDYDLTSIDKASSSANNVWFSKVLLPADIDVTELYCLMTNTGTDTVYLGIYDSALNRLVQSTLNKVTPNGINYTASFPAVSLTGGNEYWLAIKGDNGSFNFGAQDCLNNPSIARQIFFGGVGLPATMAGTFGVAESAFIGIRA